MYCLSHFPVTKTKYPIVTICKEKDYLTVSSGFSKANLS